MRIIVDLEDPRPIMEWEVAYLCVGKGYCSACGYSVPQEQRPVFVTRERVDNPDVPLGRLYTRCARHQMERDALLEERAMYARMVTR